MMHAPDAPIRDRIRAATELLRIYPHDWDPPRLKYIIGGIPSEALGTCHASGHPGPAMESTENHSHSREISHKTLNHSGDTKASVNIETIISDIKSGNYPKPTLCSICGHYMPYPCSKTPMH